MTPSTPAQILERYFIEAWQNFNESVIHQTFAPGAKLYVMGETDYNLTGPDEFLQYYRGLRAAVPESRTVLEECFGDATRAAARWRAWTKPASAMFGIEASGASAEVLGISMARFENGMIVEGWDIWDRLGMAQQLAPAMFRTKVQGT